MHTTHTLARTDSLTHTRPHARQPTPTSTEEKTQQQQQQQTNPSTHRHSSSSQQYEYKSGRRREGREWPTQGAGLLAVDVGELHVGLADVGPQGGTVVDDVNTGSPGRAGGLRASG